MSVNGTNGHYPLLAHFSSMLGSFLRKSGAKMSSRQPPKFPLDEQTAQPSLLERSGIHAMRERAVTWCRAHPVEAAELPGWNLVVLRRVLEGVA